MSIEFLSGGILTTVQDLGRNRFRSFGINPAGAMDQTAVRLINILLGNNENESVLEIHFPAPKILFNEKAIIALGGANFGARLNENPIENWRVFSAEKGDILSFPQKLFGNRLYLSVKGGFKIEKWLESGSTNLKAKIGGCRGKPLQKGDIIYFNQATTLKKSFLYKISKSIIPHYSAFPTVRFVAGAEFEKLTQKSKNIFQERTFIVRNESDRMGFRLKGESLELAKKIELLSSAVNFGAVQLLPDGQLIVLMADHQTTGGYPRIAHIISRDLPLIAQLGAADELSFKIVSISEAENEISKFERDLNFLKTGCQFKVF